MSELRVTPQPPREGETTSAFTPEQLDDLKHDVEVCGTRLLGKQELLALIAAARENADLRRERNEAVCSMAERIYAAEAERDALKAVADEGDRDARFSASPPPSAGEVTSKSIADEDVRWAKDNLTNGWLGRVAAKLDAKGGEVTREEIAEIIGADVLTEFQQALEGYMANGEPIHLAHHYAYGKCGPARDAVFAKADDALAALSPPEAGGGGGG